MAPPLATSVPVPQGTLTAWVLAARGAQYSSPVRWLLAVDDLCCAEDDLGDYLERAVALVDDL